MSLSGIFLFSPSLLNPPPAAQPAPKLSPLEEKRHKLITLVKNRVSSEHIQKTLGYSPSSIRVYKWRYKTNGATSLLPKTTSNLRTQKQVEKARRQETIRNKAIALWEAKIASYRNIASLLQQEYRQPVKESSVRVWISRHKKDHPLTTIPPNKSVIKV